jgi:hypothetical protein
MKPRCLLGWCELPTHTCDEQRGELVHNFPYYSQGISCIASPGYHVISSPPHGESSRAIDSVFHRRGGAHPSAGSQRASDHQRLRVEYSCPASTVSRGIRHPDRETSKVGSICGAASASRAEAWRATRCEDRGVGAMLSPGSRSNSGDGEATKRDDRRFRSGVALAHLECEI